MTDLANKVLHIMQTAEGKTSFSRSEFAKYGIPELNAEAALNELEASGRIFAVEIYASGAKAYKLS